VKQKVKLCEVDWFNEDVMYRRIYDVLNTENMLPDPCDITILPPEPPPPEARENVYGMCWPLERKIWFRLWPPPYVDYAHELIHLIPGKDVELEEMYAYNLSTFVVELAKRNVKPPANPVRLFDIDSTNVIMEAIREVYNYAFKDLADFFMWIGVIPSFLKPKTTMDGFALELDPAYNEKTIVLMTISEFAAGCEYDEMQFRVLLRLLERIKNSRN
jgi:hypothetical protein